MAKFLLHLLLVSLAFSELVRLDAVPATRSLMVQEPRIVLEYVSTTTSLVTAERGNSGMEAIDGRRMNIELNDYPGSEANNRHTPRP